MAASASADAAPFIASGDEPWDCARFPIDSDKPCGHSRGPFRSSSNFWRRCASRTRDPTPPPAAPWPPDPPPPSGHDRPEHVRKRPVVHAPL